MEQLTDAQEMLEMVDRPAFYVKDGTVVLVNSAAKGLLIEPGTAVSGLLATGAEEYAAFEGGQLYLTLSIGGVSMGACVTRMEHFDTFRLEDGADHSELQAMALAARELRDPLTSIMITAQRLFPVSEATDDPTVREQVARINRGLYQMLRVINNMSDAVQYSAASESGAVIATDRQELLNITAELAEITAKAAALVEQTGRTLHYHGIPDDIYSLADREKLERAVLNMISNAMKFTPAGSTITVTLTKRGSKLYLCVQDNGPGIDETVRTNVFTRYQRQSALEDGRFGIGLGMVLIRAAAAVHGGTVLVDQPVGGGTRITMSLAIRQHTTGQLRNRILRVDYAGERDHGLIELSDILPAALYEKEN
ncbi:MAG: HAMP domain-containing histidine kinase [Oscillospiraceae bacterium]|nr:HAMP domain-containing histidine kinase [Oscillospiraceae bacterium]